MGAKTYVVHVIVREIRTENFGILHHDRYLVCVRWNPYNKPEPTDDQVMVTEDPGDAFVFSSIAAAEMAAVTVGGTVVLLEKAKSDYAGQEEP